MLASELFSESSSKPSLYEARSFDYAALKSETRIVVQQRTGEIKEKIHSSDQATWEIGQKLAHVRDRLKLRQFTFWLQAEFRLSRSTAYNYIKVFDSFPICPNFGRISIATSALILLAAPSTPNEARQEALKSASHRPFSPGGGGGSFSTSQASMSSFSTSLMFLSWSIQASRNLFLRSEEMLNFIVSVSCSFIPRLSHENKEQSTEFPYATIHLFT